MPVLLLLSLQKPLHCKPVAIESKPDNDSLGVCRNERAATYFFSSENIRYMHFDAWHFCRFDGIGYYYRCVLIPAGVYDNAVGVGAGLLYEIYQHPFDIRLIVVENDGRSVALL